MMGGGGGGGFFPSGPKEMAELVEAARAAEAQKHLDAQVNELLGALLTDFNSRNAEKTQEQLDQLRELLGKSTEIDALFFGGSVSKHTHVDGISDVDALVILSDPHLAKQGPAEALDQFFRTLDRGLTRDAVATVEKGDLAVTVTYRDGSQIQLLPALRDGARVFIADEAGGRWKETWPGEFKKTLTGRNAALNNQLVPAIKLVKAALAGLPPQKQLTGYHVEALALDATEGYTAAKTPKELFLHILRSAAQRVLTPIHDVTGQSRYVDEYLGPGKSVMRRNISLTLSSLARRLWSTSVIDPWKQVFGD
jgi:hypothetical protein